MTDRHESGGGRGGGSGWREPVSIVLVMVTVGLWLVFGKAWRRGPDWLLGPLLGLIVAFSLVTVTGRRTRREWLVLALLAGGAIAALASTVVE